jgi:hypothetical protein
VIKSLGRCVIEGFGKDVSNVHGSYVSGGLGKCVSEGFYKYVSLSKAC